MDRRSQKQLDKDGDEKIDVDFSFSSDGDAKVYLYICAALSNNSLRRPGKRRFHTVCLNVVFIFPHSLIRGYAHDLNNCGPPTKSTPSKRAISNGNLKRD